MSKYILVCFVLVSLMGCKEETLIEDSRNDFIGVYKGQLIEQKTINFTTSVDTFEGAYFILSKSENSLNKMVVSCSHLTPSEIVLDKTNNTFYELSSTNTLQEQHSLHLFAATYSPNVAQSNPQHITYNMRTSGSSSTGTIIDFLGYKIQ